MFSSVFGTDFPLAARFFIAFLVVLGLIGLTAWLMRRFGASRLGGGSARGRQPRLAVIDAATVDGRRRLVLIRRDNVEHLLMIGPSDMVIESNIVRAANAREPARNLAEPRLAPQAETPWPLQPASEPAARPTRASVTDEPWLAAEPGARARPSTDDIPAPNQVAPETPPVRPEPVRVTPPAPAAPPQTDHNLAEMALQLEAALRRPPENRPPVTDPLAVPSAAPPVKPVEPARAPSRDFKPRVEPKLETKTEQKPEPKSPDPASVKSSFDNLEQEMASLLGRPLGKS
ncbi:MAG TPA: flagellar biosynthetic protein FliO [Pseudolabrys sp.]|nr:flagellar biosynthetic protein FliO [Pseudolabrys sp.]